MDAHKNDGKEACAKRHGATHVHAHLTPGGDQVRLDEETDLRRLWDPPCNKE